MVKNYIVSQSIQTDDITQIENIAFDKKLKLFQKLDREFMFDHSSYINKSTSDQM